MEESVTRDISSPVTAGMLRPLPASCQWVQFSSLPSPAELDQLAALLERHPTAGLRAYGGYDGSIRDLGFLRHFPSLRRFRVDVLDLADVAGLDHLPDDVEVLGIGETRRRTPLDRLERFSGLRSLYLGRGVRHFEVVSTLTRLEALTLRGITLGGLGPLRPLERLAVLDIKLGRTRDLSLLPHIGQLRYLEIWRVSGLEDLGALGDLVDLEFLFLQSLPRVGRLPSLGGCASLRRVHLESMKALHDLHPVAEAPNLEELLVIDMPHLAPEALACFTGHPTLAAAAVGLGSTKRNRVAAGLLGLPDPPGRTKPPFGLARKGGTITH